MKNQSLQVHDLTCWSISNGGPIEFNRSNFQRTIDWRTMDFHRRTIKGRLTFTVNAIIGSFRSYRNQRDGFHFAIDSIRSESSNDFRIELVPDWQCREICTELIIKKWRLFLVEFWTWRTIMFVQFSPFDVTRCSEDSSNIVENFAEVNSWGKQIKRIRLSNCRSRKHFFTTYLFIRK